MWPATSSKVPATHFVAALGLGVMSSRIAAIAVARQTLQAMERTRWMRDSVVLCEGNPHSAWMGHWQLTSDTWQAGRQYHRWSASMHHRFHSSHRMPLRVSPQLFPHAHSSHERQITGLKLWMSAIPHELAAQTCQATSTLACRFGIVRAYAFSTRALEGCEHDHLEYR